MVIERSAHDFSSGCLLRFVQHSQCSQSAVGICSRARKLQLFSAITCDLVDPNIATDVDFSNRQP